MFLRTIKHCRAFLCVQLFLLLTSTSYSQQVTWGFKLGGSALDYSQKGFLDAAGNIYTCGEFRSSNVDFDPGPGVALRSTNGSGDGFVAKYQVTGQYVWAITIGGSNIDKVEAVCADAAGNVYIAGFFRGANVDFDPGQAPR